MRANPASLFPTTIFPSWSKKPSPAPRTRNFYSHPGIDPSGILRAAIKDVGLVLQGKRPQGASTITQQVARNFLALNSNVRVSRKIPRSHSRHPHRRHLSQGQILELYLNEIFLGELFLWRGGGGITG